MSQALSGEKKKTTSKSINTTKTSSESSGETSETVKKGNGTATKKTRTKSQLSQALSEAKNDFPEQFAALMDLLDSAVEDGTINFVDDSHVSSDENVDFFAINTKAKNTNSSSQLAMIAQLYVKNKRRTLSSCELMVLLCF